MSYLAGGSLDGRRQRNADRTAAGVPPERLSEWLPGIATALDFIHSQNYIHRDVKPGNILFDASGNPFLGDFGIAKAVGTENEATLDLTGRSVIGTPGYIAPEILLGKDHDVSVDQYSLAVVVFEMLAGRKPFEGKTFAAIVSKQTTQRAPSLASLDPNLPSELAAVLARALSRNAKKRYSNCREFAQAVQAAVSAVVGTGGRAETVRTEVQPPALPPKYEPTLVEASTEMPQQADRTRAETTKHDSSTRSTSEPPKLFANPPIRWIVAVGGGVLLLCTVLLLIFALGNGDDDPDPESILAERKQRLKAVGKALTEFADDKTHFPSHNSNGVRTGEAGRHQGLSWRVHLLPYLGEQELFDQFKHDEPWNSTHNRKLLDRMPDVYKSFGVLHSQKTSLHVFVSETVKEFSNPWNWPPFDYRDLSTKRQNGQWPTVGIRWRHITDGTTNTLFAVEAGPDKAEFWTKPGGLSFDHLKISVPQPRRDRGEWISRRVPGWPCRAAAEVADEGAVSAGDSAR